MKATDFLVPIMLFRVRYESASGRPYSEFDKCVLEAISAGAGSLEGLHTIFLLRRRLLIESVVTLARAGWIALEVSSGHFRITPTGIEALKADSMPVFTVISDCETKIVMDALTGGLIGQQAMKPYVSNKMIEEQGLQNIKKLPREFTQPRLDPGQVADYLDLAQGEWLRWVDIPEIISRESHWLPVNVNLASGVVHNLPSLWRRNLEPRLLAEVGLSPRGRLLQSPENGSQRRTKDDEMLEPKTYKETFAVDDLLLSRRQHFDVLVRALKCAKTVVFVASAFFDTSEIDDNIRALILEALKRGVQICFLWGYAVYHGKLTDESALNWLRTLKKEAGQDGRKLRYNQEATDSHSKLLIFDDDTGFRAYVGSCNWLSACLALKGDARQPTEVTVGLRHPALIASLCRSAAGFWTMSRRGGLADAPELLRRAAEKLDIEAQNAKASDSERHDFASVRIIRDQEHETKMRELLFHAKERCLVISNKFGAKATIRLEPLVSESQKRCEQVSVQYSKLTPGAPDQKEIETTLAALSKYIKQIPTRHSKIIVVDNTAIISSYNFLSADPFGNFFNAREVGVVIEGGNIPDLLWKAHVTDWEKRH